MQTNRYKWKPARGKGGGQRLEELVPWDAYSFDSFDSWFFSWRGEPAVLGGDALAGLSNTAFFAVSALQDGAPMVAVGDGSRSQAPPSKTRWTVIVALSNAWKTSAKLASKPVSPRSTICAAHKEIERLFHG
ncbi:MAG: hypothetical protein AB7O62_25195 [Pirellulales bacterium]